MRSSRVLLLPFLAACAACSSTPEAPEKGADAGTSSGSMGGESPSPGAPSGAEPESPPQATDGFDFAFASSGANVSREGLVVPSPMGAFCQGASPNKTCSFTASVTEGGCTYILNAAFVGDPPASTAFPFAADPTTPPGKAQLTYTEACGAKTRMWRASAGTLTLLRFDAPAAGTVTGTASFSVEGATMGPAPAGAGEATGAFTVSGEARNVSFTGT